VKDADLAEIGGGSLRIGVGVGVPFTILLIHHFLLRSEIPLFTVVFARSHSYTRQNTRLNDSISFHVYLASTSLTPVQATNVHILSPSPAQGSST
jgi:hypothetical protein